jgi:hypothetical protein
MCPEVTLRYPAAVPASVTAHVNSEYLELLRQRYEHPLVTFQRETLPGYQHQRQPVIRPREIAKIYFPSIQYKFLKTRFY